MPIERVFVAGVTANRQYLKSYDSFRELAVRPTDSKFYKYGGRGDVNRTDICNRFLAAKEYDALMLCDLDQIFPKDALEHLREHDKDMVAGHYLKRTTRHIVSIWQWGIDDQWPFIPYTLNDVPREGLHPIKTTGLGCVLIKRKVIEAVNRVLPPGASPFEIGKLPEVAFYQTNFGSDYRFFYLAQKLGFKLWGDAYVDCSHATTLWIDRDTIENLTKEKESAYDYFFPFIYRNAILAKGMATQNAFMARILMLENARKNAESELQDAVISGQIAECKQWIKWLEEEAPPAKDLEHWKAIYGWEKPQSDPSSLRGKRVELPVFQSKDDIKFAIDNRDKAIGGETDEEVAKARKGVWQEEAQLKAEEIDRANKMRITSNEGELKELD